MDWKYKENDLVTFNTVQRELVYKNGTQCKVIRKLTDEEYDLFELGPMYLVRACDTSQWEVHAFEDELSNLVSKED